jgi:NADPH:quinone reductase-like Zn-dependent oxidoreductase
MEAATLPCAALTAWNALYGGAPGRILKPGDTALTQGTGGVSIFALQFARAGGAEVISTTSSPEKAAKLKALGATHVIDYKADPEWGATAKQLSQGQRGVDFIVEIGGSNTLTQSANASAGLDSTIAIIGQRAQVKGETAPNPHSLLTATRRIIVGNRLQFEEMNRAIEANHIKPVIDAKTFGFTELKEALAYLESGEHFGKIVLKIE